LVAADDGIELAGAGLLGQVAPELLEGLHRVLGVLRGHAPGAAHVSERGEDLLAGELAHAPLAERPVLVGSDEREQQVLGGEGVVGELLALGVRGLEEGEELAPGPRLGAVGGGEGDERLLRGVAELDGVGAGLAHDGQDEAVLLAEQSDQEVVGGDLGVVALLRRLERGVHRLGRLVRPGVRAERHLLPLLTSSPAAVTSLPPTCQHLTQLFYSPRARYASSAARRAAAIRAARCWARTAGWFSDGTLASTQAGARRVVHHDHTPRHVPAASSAVSTIANPA